MSSYINLGNGGFAPSALSPYTISGTVSVGDAVYLVPGSPLTVARADADDATKRPVLGLVSGITGSTAMVAGSGAVASGLSGLTTGSTYWLGTTPGSITSVKPSSDSYIIGVAISTTQILVGSIPTDLAGAAGPQGATGPQGPQGDAGATGATGAQGAQGADGVAVNWTEAASTSAPNATVPAVSFTPNNAATNVDAVITPKGTGALLADVPNNASSGGNKRGIQSVDFQLARSNANQVASGIQATISGGTSNRASATYAAISGGAFCVASGDYAVANGDTNTASGANSKANGKNATASGVSSIVSGGEGCQATNTTATVGGGNTNIASGFVSTISGGANNTASKDYSTIPGGRQAASQHIYEICHASGQFAAAGDAQASEIVLRRSITVGAAATDITIDGGAPTTANTLVLANNSALGFRINVIARDTAKTGQFAWWTIHGGISRDGAANTTQIVGTNVVDTGTVGADAAGWTCVAQANTTNGSLQILVSAPAGTGPVRFVGTVNLTRVA